MVDTISIELLKKAPQWVCWREETVNGRPTKVPYRPLPDRLIKAAADDSSSWGTHSDAEWAHMMGDYTGVGFVFKQGGGVVGIDLDGCRNPGTGEIAPWAREIISRFDSYTEISPSETGVHIIVQGYLPTEQTGWSRYIDAPEVVPGKKPKLEIYQSGRYFTFTGKEVKNV